MFREAARLALFFTVCECPRYNMEGRKNPGSKFKLKEVNSVCPTCTKVTESPPLPRPEDRQPRPGTVSHAVRGPEGRPGFS